MDVDWISRARDLKPRVLDFVDGRWKPGLGDELVSKFGSRDGKLLYEFSATSPAQLTDAVAAASTAFQDGRWSGGSAQHRKETLLELASLVENHREELALLECLDVGKPIRDALTIDIPFAVSILRYNAEAVDKLYSKIYAVSRSNISFQLRRPVGVVAAIVGWNFPLVLAAQKIAPALAMGNSLVLKPSEFTSLAAGRLAELALEAGLPPGVLNVVNGGASVGNALARHPDVDLLTFTGSSRTGKALLVAAGESNMKRLLLECGGKAPSIVFDDCPTLEEAADAIVSRVFWNQGEVCSASSRLLVHESVKPELMKLVIQKADALRPGDPLIHGTAFGALVSGAHMKKVLGYVDAGIRDGATLIHQTTYKAPFADGFYVPPTIFADVAPNHRIAQEEIFGPVLSVISFQDEAEAVRIANGTVYGLSAILWTKDLGRAHRLALNLCAGSIVINATAKPEGGPAEGVIPSGGLKQSGFGVEGGLEGLVAYSSPSAVQIFV